MLCREIIAVWSEIHTEHINTHCVQNEVLLTVETGGASRIQRVKICLKNSYSEFHGSPTNDSFVDTRSHADSPKDVTSTKRFSFFTSWKTPCSLCMKD